MKKSDIEYLNKIQDEAVEYFVRTGLHPDKPDFWKKHTLKALPEIREDISEGLYIREEAQKEFGLPEEIRGSWMYAPNKEIYNKKIKEGYQIAGLHKESKIPLLFKPRSKNDRPSWFLPPFEERRKSRKK
jgi:hypothetical protein